jgi:glycine oxidase
MHREILIVGQGLAGTMLAWECERAGIPFEIADLGHANAASKVAAGIINPITGQRIVKSWRVDTLLPIARESYQSFETELGVPLWRDMRVRRFYLNEDERRILAEKQARGELADYAGASDGDGFWIEGAAQVDVPLLIASARQRWLAAGVLYEKKVDCFAARHDRPVVIDCSGSAGGPFAFVAWQFSKGESLTIQVDGLAPAVVLNRGHWVLPIGGGFARVGATHVPAKSDRGLTAEARTALEESAVAMCGRSFIITAQEAGVRSYVADKKPVVGRHPDEPRLGVCNGLGAKGALFAPALARQWVNHLNDGAPFDRELDVVRFWRPARNKATVS